MTEKSIVSCESMAVPEGHPEMERRPPLALYQEICRTLKKL